jgi:tRNA-dihydrouridine synthase B
MGPHVYSTLLDGLGAASRPTRPILICPESAVKIGPVEISATTRLAPMAGITNAPFRLVARECGSGLTTTEEIDAASLLLDTSHADAIAAIYPEEHPLAMQLLGNDAGILARAACKLEELGADIVDLNMGCPMPKITGKGQGAALMRDVPAAARAVRAMRRALRVPFTVKIRGGWDDQHLNAAEVARMAEAEGVDAVTVHPRSRSQRFTGKAPWAIIAEVVDAVGVPVTGNGDVCSMAEARRMMAETGCGSVMIGRGALGRPWVFSEAFELLSPATRRAEQLRVIARHCALLREHFREAYALIQMKKHLAWYTEGLPRAREARVALFASRSPDEAWERFLACWDRSANAPADRPPVFPLLRAAPPRDVPHRLHPVPAHGMDPVVEVERGVAVRGKELDLVAQVGTPVGIQDGEPSMLVASPRELDPRPLHRLRDERPVRRERLEAGIDDCPVRPGHADHGGEDGQRHLELERVSGALAADPAVVQIHRAVGAAL